MSNRYKKVPWLFHDYLEDFWNSMTFSMTKKSSMTFPWFPWLVATCLRMHIISAIMNFYWSHAISIQKLSNERSYKFSWISTLTEVISIRILRMRIISAIMNFYWSHAIICPMLFPFKICPMNVLISLAEF